jgi:hypothetical protein
VPTRDQSKQAALAQITTVEKQYTDLLKKLKYVNYGGDVSADEYAEFSAMCLGLLDRLTSRHNAYYQEALRQLQSGDMTTAALASALHGLVASLKRDIEAGTLARYAEREHAVVYDDLLQTAAGLVAGDHHNAAVILLGGVLIAHLRQLARVHELVPSATSEGDGEEPDPLSPNELNDLLRESVYDASTARNVATWLHRYRQACQGNPAASSRDLVSLYLQGLRVLLMQYPA